MERLSKALGRGNKKKGKKSGQPAEVQEIGQNRSINFNKEESDMLLAACREIQIQNGKTDLNFTTHEMQQIHGLYSANNEGIPRTQLHLSNRLKIMKKEFNIFRELSTKSGWSWDYENHMVIPSSPEVFAELIKSEPKRLKYYDRKNIPGMN